jgi:hypothetical protein
MLASVFFLSWYTEYMVRFSPRKHTRHIDTRLRNRIRLYFIISLVLLLVVLFDIFTGVMPLLVALIGLVIGGGMGILASRMFHLSWDRDGRKIVSRMDVFGIVILVLYVLTSLFRRLVIGYFVHGPAITGMTFDILTGVMFGRVLGMRGRIIRILKEEGVF